MGKERLGFGNFSRFQTAGAYLDGFRLSANHCLDFNEVGLEQSLGFHTDMLSGTAFFLGETFPGDIVTGNGTFSADFTFSGHSSPSYEHITLSGTTLAESHSRVNPR
jgi:hypothetical protein